MGVRTTLTMMVELMREVKNSEFTVVVAMIVNEGGFCYLTLVAERAHVCHTDPLKAGVYLHIFIRPAGPPLTSARGPSVYQGPGYVGVTTSLHKLPLAYAPARRPFYGVVHPRRLYMG